MVWAQWIAGFLWGLVKGVFGASKPGQEKISETKENPDVESALSDPGRLPDPNKLRDNANQDRTSG